MAVGGGGLGAAGEGPLPDLGSEALPSSEVEDGSPCDWFWRAAWGLVLLSYLVVLFRHEGVDTHQHGLDGITCGEPILWPGVTAGIGVARGVAQVISA